MTNKITMKEYNIGSNAKKLKEILEESLKKNPKAMINIIIPERDMITICEKIRKMTDIAGFEMKAAVDQEGDIWLYLGEAVIL